MTKLLKADLRRVLKDKLLIVLGIIAVIFALVTPLLYVVLVSSVGMDQDPMISGLISGKAQFFSSFSIGNNLGLIAPVLIAIILCKDFSYGTVRNKIISGKSRTSIFMSLFTVCSITLIAVMLLHAFITLGFCLIFFDYQATAFTISDFWYFLVSLGLELLVLLFIAALISWLCAAMKNVGLVIVLYVAFAFALTMIAGIIQIILNILETAGGSQTAIDILDFLNRINIGNSAQYIGMGTEYSAKDLLYLTIPPIVGTLGFLGLGILKFNKKDLK